MHELLTQSFMYFHYCICWIWHMCIKHYGVFICVMRLLTTTTSLWLSGLSGRIWVRRYQKKHSPTHTCHGYPSSLICFLHLLWCMASSLFNLCAWQSFSTISKFSLVYLLTWQPPLHTPYTMHHDPDNHAGNLSLRMPFLPPNQQHQSKVINARSVETEAIGKF